jgi:hypothetical protein
MRGRGMSEYKELDSLDFAVQQLRQALHGIMALMFMRKSHSELVNQLDQMKSNIGSWGLQQESSEEILCALSHIQRAIEIEDKTEAVSKNRSIYLVE